MISMSKVYLKGFTLVELAVVLIIIGLLLGGLFVPLTAQTDYKAFSETNTTLEEAKSSLLGYAIANGRLPCPATATSNGLEDTAGVGTGVCTAKIGTEFAVGYLPAATLGVSPIDKQGFGVDGWGREARNRIRYAVSTKTINGITNPFTTTSGMKNATISFMASTTPLLVVCSAAPTGTVCNGSQLSNSVIFVVYSVGKNSATGGAGNEAANPNPNSADSDSNGVPDADDGIFVSREQESTFDDVLQWVSSSSLISRMVNAGQLP